MITYTEDDERVLYMPFDEVDRVKTERPLVGMWYVVHPERGIVFVNGTGTGGFRNAMPVATVVERLAYETCATKFAPWGRVRRIPLVYLHDLQRTAYPQRKM